MRKNNKGFVQIIIVIILIVLVGGGMYYFGTLKNNSKVTETPTEEPVVTETQKPGSPTVKPTADPTARWKTYINDQYGFSFKYPQDFVVEINQVDSSNYVQVIFNRSSDNSFTIKASANYPSNQPKYLLDTVSTGTMEVNSKSWFLFKLPNSSLGMQLENNSVLYSVIYPVSEKEVVDQILSTFKFTK